MSEEKRYGDPVFGNTLAELKALTPMTQAIDGLRFEGPAQKVGAVLTLAAVAGDLIVEIERLQGVIGGPEPTCSECEGCGSRLTTNFDGFPVIEPCPCRNAKVEDAGVSAAKRDRPVGHPMQPIEFDGKGVVRFRENRIVRHLLDFATPRGCGLNEIGRMEFSQDDRMQLAQLIGYSVSGYGDLGYASDESVETADRIADELIATEKDN